MSICSICVHSSNCGGLAWGYDAHFTPTVGWGKEDFDLYEREYRPAKEGECFRFEESSPLDPRTPLPSSYKGLLALNRTIDEALEAESPC